MLSLNRLKTLYNSSPYFIRYIYSLIPFSIRNGKEYRKWMKRLTSISSKDCKIDTVNYAFNNFSFYKQFYKNYNLNNFECLPLLNKDVIQKELNKFKKFDCKKFYVTTGGVTGKPATFYQSKNVWNKELAFIYNYFEKFGYKPKMKKASFRGGDFSDLKKNIFWKKNPIYNELHFSPFHMNINTIEVYVEKLNLVKPLYFHGYPSAFITLASLMQKKGLSLSYKPKAFFLISENYNLKNIVFIKDFFGADISSFYGHSERLIFAIASDDMKTYKPDLRYGYTELIDNNGKVIKENGITGELVGTSFNNYAMPLIRYRTGDFTYYTDYKTKTFAQIQGKWGQESLTGKNGEAITITALNLHSTELESFIKTQFIQKFNGIVDMLVITSENFTTEELGTIERMLSNRVGGLIQFSLKIVENLEVNSRGKVPLILKKC